MLNYVSREAEYKHTKQLPRARLTGLGKKEKPEDCLLLPIIQWYLAAIWQNFARAILAEWPLCIRLRWVGYKGQKFVKKEEGVGSRLGSSQLRSFLHFLVQN